jgi:integrase/recombinase XerD
MDTAGDRPLPPGRGCAVLVVPAAVRQLRRRAQDRTVRDGLGTMRMLERHAEKTVEQLQAVDVSRFLARAEIGPSSRTAYFSAMRAFFVWYAHNGGTDVTARLPRPRSPQSTPRPVSTERLRRLLNTPMHRRTLVMVLLAALAGLRVHEVAKVRGEDVDIDERTLRVTGKGGRSDTLPLHPLLVAAALTMPTRGWWFPANSRRPGDHVHAKSVSDIIGQAMRRAGIVGTPHALRHWYQSRRDGRRSAHRSDAATARQPANHRDLHPGG